MSSYSPYHVYTQLSEFKLQLRVNLQHYISSLVCSVHRSGYMVIIVHAIVRDHKITFQVHNWNKSNKALLEMT